MYTQRIPLGKTLSPPHDLDYNYILRDARIEKEYSQEELGNKVGVTLHSITAYERLRCRPSKKIQRRIAKVLEKEVYELFPDHLLEYIKQTNKQRRISKGRKIKKDLTLVPLGEKEKGLLFYLQDFDLKPLDEELQEVRGLLSRLPERKREILKLRYGFYNGKEHTLQEIADIYETSRQGIFSEIGRILDSLRELRGTWVLRKAWGID